jgi:hypothetical protein
MEKPGIFPLRSALTQLIIFVTGFTILVLFRIWNYLIFHSTVELFAICISWAIFILVWNLRYYVKSDYLLFVGVSLVFVSCIDLLHTLAYKGMNVIPNADSNLPTQLWIAARYSESVYLLAAPIFLDKKLRLRIAMPVLVLVLAALLLSIFVWKVFPVCYVEGKGLTTFKIVSEFIISGIFVGAIVALFFKRSEFDTSTFMLLAGALAIKVLSEMSFTLYADVYGIFNMAGHFLKLASFYLIYYALVRTSIIEPYRSIFRDLVSSAEALRGEKSQLEEVLVKIKVLKGLLTMCASCKRVCDMGKWKNVDEYIKAHTDVEISHGICPDCAAKLYPDLAEQDAGKMDAGCDG